MPNQVDIDQLQGVFDTSLDSLIDAIPRAKRNGYNGDVKNLEFAIVCGLDAVMLLDRLWHFANDEEVVAETDRRLIEALLRKWDDKANLQQKVTP